MHFQGIHHLKTIVLSFIRKTSHPERTRGRPARPPSPRPVKSMVSRGFTGPSGCWLLIPPLARKENLTPWTNSCVRPWFHHLSYIIPPWCTVYAVQLFHMYKGVWNVREMEAASPTRPTIWLYMVIANGVLHLILQGVPRNMTVGEWFWMSFFSLFR